MLKVAKKFWLWVLGFLLLLVLLLLLLLLLSKEACAVTLLPTNRAKFGRAKKSETKWGSDISWRAFSLSLSQRPLLRKLLKLGVASSKKIFMQCHELQCRDLQCHICHIATHHCHGVHTRLTAPWPSRRICHCCKVYGRSSTLWCCRNPTLAKCGGEAQHLEKLEVWNPPGLPNV
jgi:hypothetical protein